MKVLIIDDEEITRDGLMECVHWTEIGIHAQWLYRRDDFRTKIGKFKKIRRLTGRLFLDIMKKTRD